MAILEIHVPKAGKDAKITVDTDLILDQVVYENIFAEGLKACLNSKMSKVGAVTKMEGDELASAQAKALEIAQSNLTDLTTGKFKFPGQKAKTPAKREETNEAMRLVREYLRDQLVAAGLKVSHIPPKDVTAAAKTLIETEPKWLDQARKNLAERSAHPVSAQIDLSALGLHADPEKIAKAEAAKAKRTANLSSAQAGKVKPRGAPVAVKAKPKTSGAELLAGLTSGAAPASHPTATH